MKRYFEVGKLDKKQDKALVVHILLRYCRNENTAVQAALWGSENKTKQDQGGCRFVKINKRCYHCCTSQLNHLKDAELNLVYLVMHKLRTIYIYIYIYIYLQKRKIHTKEIQLDPVQFLLQPNLSFLFYILNNKCELAFKRISKKVCSKCCFSIFFSCMRGHISLQGLQTYYGKNNSSSFPPFNMLRVFNAHLNQLYISRDMPV